MMNYDWLKVGIVTDLLTVGSHTIGNRQLGDKFGLNQISRLAIPSMYQAMTFQSFPTELNFPNPPYYYDRIFQLFF